MKVKYKIGNKNSLWSKPLNAGSRSSTVAKVMRKEARHTQRRDRASGVPLEILEHLPPKPESTYFLLCAFTYTSDFTGGCPPLPLSEKRVSLQLQLIIPGCDCFNLQTPLEILYPAWIGFSGHMWLFRASQLWEAGDVLNCLNTDSFE